MWWLALAGLPAAFAGGCGAAGRKSVMANGDPMQEFRTAWLDAVYAASGAFTPAPTRAALPRRARLESEWWHKQVFQSPASAHRSDGAVAASFHVATPGTVDLIRFEYVVGALNLVVTESAAFLHVSCADVADLGASPGAQASELSGKLLNLPKPRSFTMIPGDPKYRSFSSAMHTPDVRIDNWADRIDGVAREEGVALLIYKKHVDYDDFVNLSQWFDAAFRAAHP